MRYAHIYKITAMYNIFKLSESDIEPLQKAIRKVMEENGIKGTMLLGVNEGINGTIAGLPESIDKFYEFIRSNPLISNTEWKESWYDRNPFEKIKVKIKKETVTMRCDANFDFTGKKGPYVKPEDWDEFISRDDVVILDTRNDYEFHIGHFVGSVNPEIDAFRDLPKWLEDNKHLYEGKKLATFCTGGMRCEKLTAWMVQDFYEETYHLEGGILNYFEKTRNKNKKWKGYCFVFDNRIAVDENLEAI
ncbi:oxygen-dependent tRNA uridine(34) hydroxylase TrhO [Candidatus Deianiraea vastatrix]|nr:rhodanese-like domain-containing protein [Candidatus Deianiraea vastatrix]